MVNSRLSKKPLPKIGRGRYMQSPSGLHIHTHSQAYTCAHTAQEHVALSQAWWRTSGIPALRRRKQQNVLHSETFLKKTEGMGLEQWLSSVGHLLVFQKTSGQFPALLKLTVSCNYTPRGSGSVSCNYRGSSSQCPVTTPSRIWHHLLASTRTHTHAFI